MDRDVTLRGTERPQLGDRDWRIVGGLQSGARVSVRLELDQELDRIVVREVVIRPSSDAGRVTSDQLQRIPLAMIERIINTHQDAMTLRDQASRLPALKRETGESSTDFAARVAEQYRILAALSPHPAKAMAEHSGVPVSRVHRWIREARKLGKLPPGRQGTAG